MPLVCRAVLAALILFLLAGANLLHAQPSHPHLFFDRAGMDALRHRVLTNSNLFRIWEKFKVARVDSSIDIRVREGGTDNLDRGRNYGDALGDMTIAYVITRDSVYADKAIEMMIDLAEISSWGNQLVNGHISMAMAFAWDVFYDWLSAENKNTIRDGILAKAENHDPNDVYSNINWTPAAGEGLIGLAFQGDGGDSFNQFVNALLTDAKWNFKGKDRNVLWAHGSDGFPHEGLGYWRKYSHVGLFFNALRFNDPENDWFHLGKEYPGSEFLKNMGYPRIYADVQHPDLACLTWADSRQVRNRPNEGPYGNIATLALVGSEYKDGYILDFIDYLVNETGVRFNGEDWATFIFYNDENVSRLSYRELPLSQYWPDMEAGIFRSGWDKDDLVFYMRSGSPAGHSRRLKAFSTGGHDHPDANGFLLFYNNDYLAAEDGSYPDDGPDAGTTNKITYGHNTFLIDGVGQKGDRTTDVATTQANMDFLDAEHVGYLLGDATDAYEGIDKFHRSVIYKKHKYLIILDELQDQQPHKYEWLLGTDNRHRITYDGYNHFTVIPETGNAIMPVAFIEPRQLQYSINRDRPYSIRSRLTDMLRVWPNSDTTRAAFLSMLYPLKTTDLGRHYTPIYEGNRSGVIVDNDEYFLYNPDGTVYNYENVSTDARLCYFKNNDNQFEYLAAGSRDFLFNESFGFRSDEPVVAAFTRRSGKIRVGKNLGTEREATITLLQPGIIGLIIDGELHPLLDSGPGWVRFKLRPRQYKIGPSNAEQRVTDNHDVSVLTQDFLRVMRPNGGERLKTGSTQTINWISAGNISSVTIDYSSNAGQTWKNIVADIPNSGNYRWLIPDDVSSMTLVRVANSISAIPSDVSDAPFVIFKPNPPLIQSFHPDSGTVGSVVTISGSFFNGTTGVSFNTSSADFTVVADSVITAVVPASASTGAISVVNDEGVASSADSFTVLQPPTIASFSPGSGLVGTEVTILGNRFLNVVDVLFNSARADSFSVISESEIRAEVPGAASSGKIRITTASGTAESAQDFVVVSPTMLFLPSDDAYVMSSSPQEVRGVSDELRVRTHPSNVVYSFLKFQVSGLAGVVQSAKVRLQVDLASRDGGGIYSVSNSYRGNNSPWEEENLNWENAPRIEGNSLSTVDSVGLGEIIEFDVTPAIAGDGIYSFGLKSVSVDLVRYHSRESAFPPNLVIELSPGPLVQPSVDASLDAEPGVKTLEIPLPREIFLKPNYPNPFNNETIIEYGLPSASQVRVIIYNLKGQVVRTLVDGYEAAGFKKAQWDGRDHQGIEVGSGLYFVTFEVGNIRAVRKVILQK